MVYIRFGEFFVLRGILLSLSGDTIRVALEECGDAAEYRKIEGGWISELGERVEIEMQPVPRTDTVPIALLPAAVERSIAHCCVV
jgi:hypothetical protein